MKNKPTASIRYLYLAVGTLSMLFAGILYAWSILKTPLAGEFGWDTSALALNFTLTMCFFCLGGFFGSQIARKLGAPLTIVLAGCLAGAGFILTGFSGGNVYLLYVTYAVLAGLGIGVSYNVIISTVNAWFPDKRGVSSGCLLMGFGASSLLFGTILDKMFAADGFGWRKTYILFGIAVAVCLAIAGAIIRRPGEDTPLPAPKKSTSVRQENFESKEYTTGEMLRRLSFWMAFVCLSFLAAVGNTVISFARDLALSVDAGAALATTLVGVLAVCNGLGRIITGAVFDSLGRRLTMIGANLLAILSAGMTLLAVTVHSLPLCIVGLCLTGLSYGAAPTVCSAFVSSFYGQKHFATNYSIINFTAMTASFIATACNALLAASGAYVAPFVLLLSLACGALVLNLCIRRP
jgi:OFA family oxalate/formate antiporter-like MFS transporter